MGGPCFARFPWPPISGWESKRTYGGVDTPVLPRNAPHRVCLCGMFGSGCPPTAERHQTRFFFFSSAAFRKQLRPRKPARRLFLGSITNGRVGPPAKCVDWGAGGSSRPEGRQLDHHSKGPGCYSAGQRSAFNFSTNGALGDRRKRWAAVPPRTIWPIEISPFNGITVRREITPTGSFKGVEAG